MNNPIIIIDDDDDDLEIIQQTIFDLKCNHEVITFNDPHKFLDFMLTSCKKF